MILGSRGHLVSERKKNCVWIQFNSRTVIFWFPGCRQTKFWRATKPWEEIQIPEGRAKLWTVYTMGHRCAIMSFCRCFVKLSVCFFIPAACLARDLSVPTASFFCCGVEKKFPSICFLSFFLFKWRKNMIPIVVIHCIKDFWTFPNTHPPKSCGNNFKAYFSLDFLQNELAFLKHKKS